MKQVRRWKRIFILALLCVSVFAPIFFVSSRLQHLNAIGQKEFFEEFSSIKYDSDAFKLSAIEQEEEEVVKEPKQVFYKDKDHSGISQERYEQVEIISRKDASFNYDGREEQGRGKITSSDGNIQSNQNRVSVQRSMTMRPQTHQKTDGKIREIRDQIVWARAYINVAPPGKNFQLVKDLRTRMKELERAVGDAVSDTDVSRSTLQKLRSLEASVHTASRVFRNCPAMANVLRNMSHEAEKQVPKQKKRATNLLQLAARTTPKGLHCLSLRLTTDYFALEPAQRQPPSQQGLHDPNLYHYAVFSDNVLASAVVVNSTVSSAREPEKIVFHLVTDSLHFPEISMWFLLNSPAPARIHIQDIGSFDWLPWKHKSFLEMGNSGKQRSSSPLKDLVFYLPRIFPELNKVIYLDHDVVVQEDLSDLWSVDMMGKVNGAVRTCQGIELPPYRMDVYTNMTDVSKPYKSDAEACTWAFGMNLLDLGEWRRRNPTPVLQQVDERAFWEALRLQDDWLTSTNQTTILDTRWHLLGLGQGSGRSRRDIEGAAVIHYNGIMKPWLDIGIANYKCYWSKYVQYDHPYLQRCNIHP